MRVGYLARTYSIRYVLFRIRFENLVEIFFFFAPKNGAVYVAAALADQPIYYIVCAACAYVRAHARSLK